LSVLLKVFAICDEKIINLLGVPKSFAHEDNVYHTEMTASFLLPLQIFVATSAEEYVTVVSLALKSLAYISANTGDVVSGGITTIIENTIVSMEESKIWRVDFVELGTPLHFSDPLRDHSMDPFWAQARRLRSVYTIADYLTVATGGAAIDDRLSPSKKRAVDDSLVSYLLADLLRANTSGIAIGCLRADLTSFDENANTLESLSKLDEIFHEKHDEPLEEDGPGAESPAPVKSHEAAEPDEYTIPVDLTQWLSDCSCEIQNFTQLHKYKDLRYPVPATPSPEDVDATRPFEEPKETPDIQADLHTIRVKIAYLARKRHHLKELLDCVLEIKRKHSSASPPRTDQSGLPRSYSTASVLSSTQGRRSFEETNKEVLGSMLDWLRGKGLFVPQPRDPAEVMVLRQGSTDTRSVSSVSEDADPATADPSLMLLGPNGLAEQHCLLPLRRGYTILRVSRSNPAEDALLRLNSVETALGLLDQPATEPLANPPSPLPPLPPLGRRSSVDSSLSQSVKSEAKKGRRSKGKSKATQPQQAADDDSVSALEDDDLSFASGTAPLSEAAAAPAEAEATAVPLDPRASLNSRSEEQSYQAQLQQLTGCGVLPAPVVEEPATASSDLLSNSSAINKLSASSAIAARIQRSRERQKQAQQTADRRSAAAKAAEDAVNSLTLHCPDGRNPFAAVLGDLRLLGVFVQRFDQVRLVPAAWHFARHGAPAQTQTDQPALLTLNGRPLDRRLEQHKAEDGVELADGDILQVGVFIFLRVHIPRKARPAAAVTAVLTGFESAVSIAFDSVLRDSIYADFLCERRQTAHLDVQRELNAITKQKEKTRLMRLQAFRPGRNEVDLLVDAASPLLRFQVSLTVLQTTFLTLLAFQLRKPLSFRTLLRPTWPEAALQQLGRDELLVCDWLRRLASVEDLLQVLVSELDEPSLSTSHSSSRSSWLWPHGRFLHRLLCAAELLQAFSDPLRARGDLSALTALFPAIRDPLQDTVRDELVGVAFLYVDPLLHLLDVDDCVKIVSFNGDPAGFLKLSVRSWVDEVEPVPSYITADVDVDLQRFLGRRLVVRVFFEHLTGLPAGHCADSYVYFKFMKQFPAFLTPRFVGCCERPQMDVAVQLEELICEDLLGFLRNGCIELEVFAKKRPALVQSQGRGQEKVGEANYVHLVDMAEEDVLAAALRERELQAQALAAQRALLPATDYRAQSEQLAKQLQSTRQELHGKKKQLKMASKLADGLRAGKEAFEKRAADKLEALQSQLALSRGENQGLARRLAAAEAELTAKLTVARPSKACCVQ